MRMKLAFAVAVALMALGCSDSSNPVAQYGDAMTSAYSKGKAIGPVADLNSVKMTIAAYYASNEKYPASLEEVSALMRTPLPPDMYSYDPSTGVVSLK